MTLVNPDPQPSHESPGVAEGSAGPDDVPGFLSSQPTRRRSESLLVRLVATAGIIAIATAVGAILAAADVEGWIVALGVALLSVSLAAVLWRSRVL